MIYVKQRGRSQHTAWREIPEWGTRKENLRECKASLLSSILKPNQQMHVKKLPGTRTRMKERISAASAIIRYAKEQENMTDNEEINQSIRTNPEPTQVL